jgi:hypothetical protein
LGYLVPKGFIHGNMIETLGTGVSEVYIGLHHKHLARHSMTPNLEKAECMVVKHGLCRAAFPHIRVVKPQLTDNREKVGA